MNLINKNYSEWFIGRRVHLYLLSTLLVTYWIFEAVEWYRYSLNRFGEGTILHDEVTQLYLLYATYPAIYAFSKSFFIQNNRMLKFFMKFHHGSMIAVTAVLFVTFAYILINSNV